MQSDSSDYVRDMGIISAATNSEILTSGIRATVGNRRKSIDVIRFRAQPDEEQNRVYGDGDEFNPDRTRMFARMKRETMRCKHCSDEMNERRRKMRLEQDVPTMNYVCKKNRGIANGIDKDSQNLKNGQVSVPSSSHVRAEDGYDKGRSIHADGEQFKSTIRGKDEIPSVNFATRADDEEDVRLKKVIKTNFPGLTIGDDRLMYKDGRRQTKQQVKRARIKFKSAMVQFIRGMKRVRMNYLHNPHACF